jgi:hypothetical protein
VVDLFVVSTQTTDNKNIGGRSCTIEELILIVVLLLPAAEELNTTAQAPGS